MKKLSLKELKVSSFVTNLNTASSETVKGGATLICIPVQDYYTRDRVRCGKSVSPSACTEC